MAESTLTNQHDTGSEADSFALVPCFLRLIGSAPYRPHVRRCVVRGSLGPIACVLAGKR